MKNQDQTHTNTILGILGNPVSHSLSPKMHQAALDTLGISMQYLYLPVASNHLAMAVSGIRAFPIRGVNVTIPYKQAVMPHLDDLDAAAREAGAVNVILKDGERLRGYNTDISGFMAGFSNHSELLVSGRVLVVGAGGAASAIVAGLMRRVQSLSVVARDVTKARNLLNMAGANKHCQIAELPWPVTDAMIANHTIIVNATPIGMHGFPVKKWLPDTAVLGPSHICYDTVYTPQQTPFLIAAEAHGAQCIYGKTMLVGQGEAAFEYFTGQRPPEGLMQTVLDASL